MPVECGEVSALEGVTKLVRADHVALVDQRNRLSHSHQLSDVSFAHVPDILFGKALGISINLHDDTRSEHTARFS
ncbi:MAG: hypothetical protein KGL39_48045 [Patescibacteria group bacterium]|nr:hypothetical protein [Patescibacteria group bacterium]